MIRVRQIKINVNKDNLDNLKFLTSIKLNIKKDQIKEIYINKRSVDARKKPNIFYLYEVDVVVDNENQILQNNKSNDVLLAPSKEYKYEKSGNKKINHIVIAGAGPSGLITAYLLCKEGYNVTVIERGKQIEKRDIDVDNFFENGVLNEESNIQFGEGGAGTYSDGKLNTLIKDKENRGKYLFNLLVKLGAPEDIIYDYKPHIGTDILKRVIINLRNEIIKLGGNFRFETKLTNINVNNVMENIEVNNNEIINCDLLVLALGHSARDTFEMLNTKLKLESKPFAVGLRICHNQEMINESQIGVKNHPILKEQSYKLTHTTKEKRGVYTFCMCPGGFVVNSSSEKNMLAINGMSYHDRASGVANSAVIVTINQNDFGDKPLDGINYQRNLEKAFYEAGKGKMPVQLYKDFVENKVSTSFKSVKPKFKGDTTFYNLNDILPEYIGESIKEALISFNTKIKGFTNNDAILSGIESRTSSPIKIIRDENFESNIENIYPVGEGAGYAGGITSSFIDGMKTFEKIIQKYKN